MVEAFVLKGRKGGGRISLGGRHDRTSLSRKTLAAGLLDGRAAHSPVRLAANGSNRGRRHGAVHPRAGELVDANPTILSGTT